MRLGGVTLGGAVPVVVALLALTVASGCPQPECEKKTDLVVMDAWTLMAPEDDPFSPPAEAPLCAESDIRMEPFGVGGPIALDVDTNSGCGWATLTQPLAVDLDEGDEVQIRVFYFSQSTFPADTATLKVAFADDVVWTVDVPIPVGSAVLEAPRVVLQRPVAAGTPAFFHLGNHGNNSWNLLELSTVEKVFCED